MRTRSRTSLLAIVAVGAVALNVILKAASSRAFYWSDDYAHLLFSRQAADLFRAGDIGDGMTTVLNGWGRPLMTVTYIPAAMLNSDSAVRATSLSLLFIAAALCVATARRLALPVPVLAALLLLAQPLTATLGLSALPGIVFTTLLAAAFWLRSRGNDVGAAVIISLLPLARLEGVIVIGLCALLAVKGRRPRVLAVLGVGIVLWVGLSAVFSHDPLLALHSAHTATLTSSFERVRLTYVLGACSVAFGPVIAGLALASPLTKRFVDPLVPLTAASLVVFYAAVWAVGTFESLPNPVYLTTAAVPIALCAHTALAGLLERKRPVVSEHWQAGAMVLLFVAALVVGDGRRMFAVALGVVLVHRFADRVRPGLSLRRLTFVVAAFAAAVLGIVTTHAPSATGAPNLVAQVRQHFGDRLDEVVLSNDPTFNWEVEPRATPPDRRNAAGMLLVWNPRLASYSHAASDEQLERLGFRKIWVALDPPGANARESLVVWEHEKDGPLPDT